MEKIYTFIKVGIQSHSDCLLSICLLSLDAKF